MAKYKTTPLPVTPTIDEQDCVSDEVSFEKATKVYKQVDPMAEHVKVLVDKGFDDNRIASKLLIPLDYVKKLK